MLPPGPWIRCKPVRELDCLDRDLGHHRAHLGDQGGGVGVVGRPIGPCTDWPEAMRRLRRGLIEAARVYESFRVPQDE